MRKDSSSDWPRTIGLTILVMMVGIVVLIGAVLDQIIGG
jgi:hypothetical protein